MEIMKITLIHKKRKDSEVYKDLKVLNKISDVFMDADEWLKLRRRNEKT